MTSRPWQLASPAQPGRQSTHRPRTPLSRFTWHSRTSPNGSASWRSSSAGRVEETAHTRASPPLSPSFHAHLQSPCCAAHSRTPCWEGKHAHHPSTQHAQHTTLGRRGSPRPCLRVVPLLALLRLVHVFVDRFRPHPALRRPLRCTLLLLHHGLLTCGFLRCCYGHSPRTRARTDKTRQQSVIWGAWAVFAELQVLVRTRASSRGLSVTDSTCTGFEFYSTLSRCRCSAVTAARTARGDNCILLVISSALIFTVKIGPASKLLLAVRVGAGPSCSGAALGMVLSEPAQLGLVELRLATLGTRLGPRCPMQPVPCCPVTDPHLA